VPRRAEPGSQPSASGDGRRWIALGTIMGAHGVRGTVRFKPHNPDSELLFELDWVMLRDATRFERRELESVRPGTKGLLIDLQGVETMEDAQALLGAELCVARDQLPELPEGEYYFVDLEGLAVSTPDGAEVGVVERVAEYPAAQVLRVRAADGVWEVPMREPYLVAVDLEAGRVTVDHLADLELEPAR
jgi:16S rRNA processing protein RimM